MRIGYYCVLKIFVLLYADDTIVLAESPTELQSALDALFNYCETLKLYVNTAKTKVLVFSRGKIRKPPEFNFGLSKAIRYLYDQANREMFCLIYKARKLLLPVDIQFCIPLCAQCCYMDVKYGAVIILC